MLRISRMRRISTTRKDYDAPPHEMSVAQVTRLTKELTSLAPWGVPGSILVGWMAWPALTPTFKEETLGLKPTTVSPPVTSNSNKDVFRSSGKYKFVKSEIGEPPVLEEEE